MEEYISKVTPCSVIAKTPLRKALEAPLGCEAILSQEKEKKIASQARNDETIETNKSWQSIIHEMRMIKTAEEIVKIRNCIQITESIYQAVLEQVQP
jgi:Xaa-Pro aminopeptidase